ncbi:MAG TPA: hypothetical protein VHD36_00655 [Pirellulales bacterium]|nr:hypothetical protein [Pirellulales bacterium]
MLKPSSFVKWLFSRPDRPLTVGEIVGWWEMRRLAFNLVFFGYGLICFIVFLAALSSSGHLAPGEDAVEPLAIPFTVLASNVLYTLGWIVETIARVVFRTLTPRLGPVLFGFGLGFSMLVLSVPATIWTAVRLLQLAGVMA